MAVHYYTFEIVVDLDILSFSHHWNGSMTAIKIAYLLQNTRQIYPSTKTQLCCRKEIKNRIEIYIRRNILHYTYSNDGMLKLMKPMNIFCLLLDKCKLDRVVNVSLHLSVH